MMWAVDVGILNGVEQQDGTRRLDPLGTTTRAQVAAILMNCVDNGLVQLS